jgi:predicted N-formylglutamate amidohydrolase
LFTCEHASRRFPREFKRLGLTKEEEKNCKDLNDPGAFELLKILSEKMNASYLYSNVSRLVIDANRKLDARNKNENTFHACALKTELLVEKDGKDVIISIPGNQFSSEGDFIREEHRRYDKYVVPYRDRGYDMIEGMRGGHKKSYVIMLHSFYPVYNGEERTVDIGVLHWDACTGSSKVIKNLRRNCGLNIGDNKPWHIDDADGGIFSNIEEMTDVDLIIFDINNKHLQTKKDIEKIADLLLNAFKELDVD